MLSFAEMIKNCLVFIMLAILEASCGRTPTPVEDPHLKIAGEIEFSGQLINQAHRCMLSVSAENNSETPFEFTFLDIQYYLGSRHVWTLRTYSDRRGTPMLYREAAEKQMPQLPAATTTITKQTTFGITDIFVNDYCADGNKNIVGATASFVTVDGQHLPALPVKLTVR